MITRAAGSESACGGVPGAEEAGEAGGEGSPWTGLAGTVAAAAAVAVAVDGPAPAVLVLTGTF